MRIRKILVPRRLFYTIFVIAFDLNCAAGCCCLARPLLEVGEELERRLDEPLVPPEETVVTAEMSTVLVRSYQNVLVFGDRFVRDALGTDDWVVFDVVDERGHFYVRNVFVGRVVLLVGLKTLFIIKLPI